MIEIDLDDAIRTGLIDERQALDLRNHASIRNRMTLADEERFGVLGGMSDLMAAAGICFVLGSGCVLAALTGPSAAFLVALTCWGGAELFTRRKKLALTSIAILAFFTLSVTMMAFGLALLILNKHELLRHAAVGSAPGTFAIPPSVGLLTTSLTLGATALYWLRFRVPVAYTIAMVAALNVPVQLLRLLVPDAPDWLIASLLLMEGVALFVIAMAWDITDVRRETRRAEVAFWLHLAAGFQLASAIFKLVLGVSGAPRGWNRLTHFDALAPGIGNAPIVIGIALAFTAVALVVDRRSVLMSSLAYVLPAAAVLGRQTGNLSTVLAAFLVGVFLLGLAAYWRPLRKLLLARLPIAVRAQLPRTDLKARLSRPVR